MKKITLLIASAAIAASSFSMSAIDLKGLANGLGGGKTDVSDIVNTVVGLVGGTDVDFAKIAGNWSYKEPAISFESDNLLQKAGGAAASSMITKKLEPYYKMAGATKMKMTFGADNTFSASIGAIKASGEVVSLGDGAYEFHFKALGSVPAGKIKGYMSMKGSNLLVTFNATRLMEIVKKIASVSNSSTVKTAAGLIDSYDGLNIGVELTKK